MYQIYRPKANKANHGDHDRSYSTKGSLLKAVRDEADNYDKNSTAKIRRNGIKVSFDCINGEAFDDSLKFDLSKHAYHLF